MMHVGLLTGSVERSVKKLLNEGHTPVSKGKSIYVKQIKAFIGWARKTSFEFDSDYENDLINDKYKLYWWSNNK